MQDRFFFGYGSLVNQATHNYTPLHRATARGWRRGWRATQGRQVAYLTAVRDPACTIDGMIAPVPGESWAALDAREAAYDRLAAAHEIAHEVRGTPDIVLYAIALDRLERPTERHPVLLSYLDVVVQGYLHAFGEDGVLRFFETTDGWEAPFLDDRAAPRYPRAQQLHPEEQALVDAMLARYNARVVPSADARTAT